MSDDFKPSNPKDAAATTRLDLSLFPASARAYGALAFTEGDLKYGGYNYREAGVCVSVYVAALGRHVDKFYNGEWADPKTKVPHLASALACVAVMIDGFEQGNINDDRPPAQTSDLYDRFQKIVEHLQAIFPRQANRFRADQYGDPTPPPAYVLPEGATTHISPTGRDPLAQHPDVVKYMRFQR